MIGLVFGIVVILFIAISILLIYSLLMISVETKNFETAILRVLGVSKFDCISMILIQSCMFVLPSIIMAYIRGVLAYVDGSMFKDDNIKVAPIP